jgi:hypothetical protein
VTQGSRWRLAITSTSPGTVGDVPSFRVTMTLGALRPGVAPEQVQPRAEDAAREVAVLESSQVDVVRGEARLTVRFTVEDAELALQVARHVATTTGDVVQTRVVAITERDGGAWRRIG